jgi:hypothetical protein
MTTTPTLGSKVTFSFDFSAFSPQVTALADNSFAIVWENGTDIFGRHLDERGSFLGGDFLFSFPTSVSIVTQNPLLSPFIVQQDDGRVIVNYSELLPSTSPNNPDGNADIKWHRPETSFLPTSIVSEVEGSFFDTFIVDSTARSNGVGDFGTVFAFETTFETSTTFTGIRFVDPAGNPTSNDIFVGPRRDESQQNAAIAGLHTGFVVVAYENFNQTTFARDVRFHTYSGTGSDVTPTGEVIVSGANASFPDVLELKDGSFVVIWQDSGGVAFRRYIGNGVPLDSNPLFVPNSSGGFLPKLTALNDGGFAVAWTTIVGTELDGSPELEVVLQRFSASGTAIGSRVDLDEPGDQGLFGMSIAALEDGRIIITYGSETGDSTNITTLNYRILDPRDATILGSNGDDNIVGRTDGSFVSGLDGNDKLTGGDVQDTLNGGNGNDTLFGLGGNDNLVALDGNDSLDGGTGNDTVVGGNGNDTINGGLGLDTAVYGSEGNTVNLSLTGPQVTGSPAGSGTDRLSSVENLQTGSGNDRLTGNSSNNRLDGGTDNDTINGAEGDDTLIGGAGNDLLTGSSGRDTLTSGSTSDVDRFSFAILTQRQDTNQWC